MPEPARTARALPPRADGSAGALKCAERVPSHAGERKSRRRMARSAQSRWSSGKSSAPPRQPPRTRARAARWRAASRCHARSLSRAALDCPSRCRCSRMCPGRSRRRRRCAKPSAATDGGANRGRACVRVLASPVCDAHVCSWTASGCRQLPQAVPSRSTCFERAALVREPSVSRFAAEKKGRCLPMNRAHVCVHNSTQLFARLLLIAFSLSRAPPAACSTGCPRTQARTTASEQLMHKPRPPSARRAEAGATHW